MAIVVEQGGRFGLCTCIMGQLAGGHSQILHAITTQVIFIVHTQNHVLIQDGNTALHIASKLGNIDSVKAMLSSGAHPAIPNEVCLIA